MYANDVNIVGTVGYLRTVFLARVKQIKRQRKRYTTYYRYQLIIDEMLLGLLPENVVRSRSMRVDLSMACTT